MLLEITMFRHFIYLFIFVGLHCVSYQSIVVQEVDQLSPRDRAMRRLS